jgi:hypothetical protein
MMNAMYGMISKRFKEVLLEVPEKPVKAGA